jgi:aspartate kinase
VTNQVTVMKFGGTSLEDAKAFQRVAGIVANCDDLPVVIASAMSGMTDALLASVRAAANGEINVAVRSLEEHFERHMKVASSFGQGATERIRALVENARLEIGEILTDAAYTTVVTPQSADEIASQGERLSANLLTIILEAHGLPAFYVDARRCLVTDEEHGNARPLIRETLRRSRNQLKPLLGKRKIPVLEGFVAATRSGVTSTMGRGSSNYTATLVSAALDVRETQIWTDVNGVLTADPALVKRPRTIPQLSYDEAIELAQFDTRVLHPRMMQPALERAIPVRICNSRSPQENGTLIQRSSEASPDVVKAIAHKTNLARFDIESLPSLVGNGLLGRIKTIFNRYQTQIDFVAKSETRISAACKETAPLYVIAYELQQFGEVEISTNHAIVSCIGEGLGRPKLTTKILQRLRQIDPRLAWHKTSAVNLTAMLDVALIASTVRRLHREVFERDHA